jgi:hypothetical protein
MIIGTLDTGAGSKVTIDVEDRDAGCLISILSTDLETMPAISTVVSRWRETIGRSRIRTNSMGTEMSAVVYCEPERKPAVLGHLWISFAKVFGRPPLPSS